MTPAGASDPGEPLPVVLVGAGGMSGAWLDAIDAVTRTRLVGVVDLDVDAARRATTGRGDVAVGDDLVAVATTSGARAVIDVTSPAAHHAVTTTALRAGLPVLGEKPVAATLAEALSLVATARVTGHRFMVSQSRRWNPHVFHLRRLAAAIGPVGTLTVEFFRAPRFGGFRDEMADPLLVDMAIHAFDSIRFVLGEEPETVTCDTWNPPWSWYAGDASGTATFTTAAGTRAVWTGSWCAPGHETSWNGSWRLSAAAGTATWDGEHEPEVDVPVDPEQDVEVGLPASPSLPHHEFAGALDTFAAALADDTTPNGDVHENVRSMAMVEAAVQSSRTGRTVELRDVLADALATARDDEVDPEVAEELARWDHPDDVLTTWADAH